jgi:hypothetical protein
MRHVRYTLGMCAVAMGMLCLTLPVQVEVYVAGQVGAIIPWGESDFGAAVDKALVERGGDALLNMTVETSLYGFIPHLQCLHVHLHHRTRDCGQV